MAKTKGNIEMDFTKAKNQATKLEEIAKELDNLASADMTECLGSIKNNWTGENANAYIKKGEIVKGNIEAVAKSLREAAVKIGKIAKNTYAAEMEALESVKNKSY